MFPASLIAITDATAAIMPLIVITNNDVKADQAVIKELIIASELPNAVKKQSIKVFSALADTEGKVQPKLQVQ